MSDRSHDGGSTDPPWHEDETFWETVRDLVFSPEKLDAAGEEVDRVLDLAGRDGVSRVLDLPCGVGRHTVAFAERGFDVTAVDPTGPYLEEGRERTVEAGVPVGADAPVEFVRADAREFRRPGAFDLAVNLYTSFGYFRDRADDQRVARNLYDSLVPGGRLVMALTSKELLAADFREREWSEQDGTYLLEEREVTDAWSWMENRWVVVDDGDVREFTVSHRLYSAHELTELLRGVGFASVDVYGGFGGSAYGPGADRLVVVAET